MGQRHSSRPYLIRTIRHSIRDIDHKCFLLQESWGSPQLLAVYLQAPASYREVKINLTFCRPSHPRRCPVILGIAGRNLYLCCSGESSPVLKLETVDKNVLDSMSSPELQPFIFFKSDSDSTCRFESAAFPNWYICSSPEARERVRMVNQLGQTAYTEFMAYPS
nr:PREDICTED: interleukin-36 receptor antagonist protein-like [Latimeria chalumnae]|eukprot:XP_005988295.2 PREDICTED: interleukin-36 receptor antagonist protein-like [Latimeria chalumnae]